MRRWTNVVVVGSVVGLGCHSTPIVDDEVVDEALAFVGLTAGGQHVCGWTASGEAYCWGDNASGQLGNGAEGVDSELPAAVAGGLRFRQLAAGDKHTCGVTEEGAAYCWGHNNSGELGNGEFAIGGFDEPGPVIDDLTFSTLGRGRFHTCGIVADGSTYCWGFGSDGQLGDGLAEHSAVPVQVAGGHSFVEIDGGDGQSCALTDAGSAYCWGDNSGGQLGDGSYADSPIPVAVLGDLTLAELAVGYRFACATASGAVYCWGEGAGVERGAVPQPAASGFTFLEIAAGHHHACGLQSSGEVHCWDPGSGPNYGQYSPPVGPFTTIVANGDYSCGLRPDESAVCWGLLPR